MPATQEQLQAMAMDGLYACNAGAVAGDAMDGLYACNAGAVAGDAGEPEYSSSCPITQVEVSMRVRRSQIDAAIRAMPAAAPIQMPGVASRP